MKNVLKTVVVVSLLAVLVGCPGNDAGLNPPEQFAAFGSSTTTITLAWSPVQNAIGYALERKSNSTAPFMPFARVDAQTTSLLDQNLTAGIDYLYRLQTFNNLGVSSSIEQHAITSADEALKTQNEMSVGQPIQKVIDSLGGTVSTADGQTLVRFPSGGVSEGTQITLQSFANPVQNNPYLGLEISSSASLSKPVIVSFQYGEQDALDAKNLVLVVQEADGSWVARPSTLDETARTISIKISDETQFPTGISTKTGPNRKTKILPLKSTWIEPKNPHVAVHKTVELIDRKSVV